MSSSTTTKTIKLIGLITVVAGFIMIVAGGVTWGLVSTQLRSENITVAAVTPEAPGRLAGKPVAGPFTAYAQANAIKHHALAGANDRTYAELGTDAKALKAKLAAGGASKADIAKDEGVIALADARDTAMNGSFLRASLFTSVVSFGVAALAIGMGVLLTLLGFALVKVSTPTVEAARSPRLASSGEAVGATA
ncbi:MAG: aromatic ring-opening dioxygenase LigA [Actinomycetota bacterium]